MAGKIHVTFRFFSHVRHVLGRSEMGVELPAGATVSEAEAHLREITAGRLEGLVFRLAVNHEYVQGTRLLADGDEVALISPVQGG